MKPYHYRDTFQSPYNDCGPCECKDLNGHPFTVVRVIEQNDDTHDQEVLPMFVIKIRGKEIEAWPEEVLKS